MEIQNLKKVAIHFTAYQWQKNGVDIAGATDAILIIPSPVLGDSLTKYQCVIGAPGAPDVTSTQVTLTVLPDTIPPVILSVGAVSKKDVGIEVSVLFDEPLTTAPSLALANFKLNTGAVTAARYVENTSGLDSRQHAIVLSTTGLGVAAIAPAALAPEVSQGTGVHFDRVDDRGESDEK